MGVTYLKALRAIAVVGPQVLSPKPMKPVDHNQEFQLFGVASLNLRAMHHTGQPQVAYG